jgi:hypothetical protein
MVRNEADIWSGFLSYHKRLFDKLVVVDHQSTDGTLEITQDLISRGEPIELLAYRHRAFCQSEISNALVRRSFRHGADWTFLLDADEFLAVPDRALLETLLRDSTADVATFYWRNLVPTVMGSWEAFDLAQRFCWNGEISRYGKLAIAAAYATREPEFHVRAGNHVVAPSHGAAPEPTGNLGAILHIPIRSMERLRQKLAWGIAAHLARPSRNATDSFHRFELSDRLAQGPLPLELLNGIITRYGEHLDEIRPVTTTGPGWQDVFLTGLESAGSPPVARASEFARREALVRWHPDRFSPGTIVSVREQDGELRLQPRPIKGDG